MSDFAALYSALGYPFRLEAYLRVVFGLPATSTDPLPDFRKLEWIGDKKLDSVLTDLLVAHFPNATMEELHESREPLKQNKGDLAKIGRGLFIYRWLPNVSDSAGLSNHRCADIMEVILGAVWFDVYSIEKAGGKADAEVRKVIIKLWQPFLRRISRPQQFNAVVNDTSFELFAAEQLRVIQPEYILGTFPIDTERALLMNISSGQVEAGTCNRAATSYLSELLWKKESLFGVDGCIAKWFYRDCQFSL